jgi:rod shape-determining protein MreD
MAANPQHILLPVRVSFMVASVIAALAFNLLPWQDLRGVPDLLALVLAFWCVHQPRKMGIGIAWLLGLLMDTANGALFGQHAGSLASRPGSRRCMSWCSSSAASSSCSRCA